jgi:hypothetical protein
LKKITPKSDEKWKFYFSSCEYKKILIAQETNRYIDRCLNQDISEDEIITLIGELISVDFDQHTITIKYPPTQKK